MRRLHIQMNVGENVMSQLERVKVERIGADNALFFQALDACGHGRGGQPDLACKGLYRCAGVFLQQAQQLQIDFIHRAVALLIYKKW